MIARFHYDRAQLQAFLDDKPSVDPQEIQSHVESCPDCQAELETLAQFNFDWEQATRLLSEPVVKLAERNGEDDPKAFNKSATTFLEPTDHPDSLGRFARYEIMELLGRGGMGIVMRGFDTSLNRHSAIKVLAPELASSAAARKRFSREAKSAAAVVHPHVVPIQTVDEHNGLPYLVMPVVEGQSLQQRVERNGPLSVIETVRIAAQVASGLQAAHEQGLVHRDIKPANVLLENGVERVQITDFGLARAIDDASMTRSGVVTGTPQYMSPEQAHGDTIDHRSDLFSLGSLIYFMLAARSPFRAETTMGVLNRIGNDEPRSLRSINADVPQWLEQIVMKLLAKSREDRFQSASEVGQLLQDWHAHLQQPEIVKPPQDLTLPLAGGSDAVAAGEGSRGRFTKYLIATAAFAFLAFAGVLIVLETNKGTLTIQCEADDVPIRIMQGDTVVEQLTVTRAGETTRIAAGNYVVAIDGGSTSLTVSGNVTLTRGSKATVRIEKSVQDLDVANSNVSSLIDQSANFSGFRPGPASEVRYVNDVANEKWGDGEPLQVAKRVFAARRQLLSNFQLSYRTTELRPQNTDEAAKQSTLSKSVSTADAGIVTVGFAGSRVYYYDRPSKKGEPSTGWIYDGKTMTRLKSVSDNEPLQVVADLQTTPDFNSLFGGEPNPLQFAGLMGMSETTVPYIDDCLREDSNATARWVLREMGSYANPRPWIPRCDRMLLIEFNCTIPVLSQTESAKPDSSVSPVRVTYVLDPGYDYWPIWYQTQTQFDTRAFRATFVRSQNIAGNTVDFPDRMIEETEYTYGTEVTDLVIGKPVNLKTVFGNAAPDLTGYEGEAPHRKTSADAENVSRTLNAIERQSVPEPESDGVQWSTSGEKDGWLSGARLILSDGGLKAGSPLVVEYRLANVSKKTKTIRCFSNSGMQFASLSTGNRIGGAYLDHQREPTMLTLQPGEVFVDGGHLVSIDTTGIQPGEYQVSLGSAFCYPDERSQNAIPHQGSIAVTLLGESNVKYQQIPKSEIQWGKPVAGLQFGASFDNHRAAYSNGEIVETDLFIANVTDQPVDCTVLLPHAGDGWRFNVQDKAGSSSMYKQRWPTDVLSQEKSIKLKLAPGEVAPITGDGIRVSFLPDPTIAPTVTTVQRAKFQIVSNEDEAKQDHPDHTVNGKLASQGGDYSATFEISLKRADIPSLLLELATPAVPFVIGAEKLEENDTIETSKQPMQKATSKSVTRLAE